MKSILKKSKITYKFRQLAIGSSFSIVSTLTLLISSPANAQVGIDSLNATYQNGTSSSYSTTVADPCTGDYSSCNSNINMQFGVGATNDLILSGFTVGADNFSLA